MSDTPQRIIDRRALQRRLVRAARSTPEEVFKHPLLDRVIQDVVDRLSFVMRNFSKCAVVAPGATELPEALAEFDRVAQVFDLRLLDGRGVSLRSCASYVAGPAVIDDEFLPLRTQSLDLIISLLTLQATNDLPGALLQARHALRPDGLFVGVLFGGETLTELRHALLEAESEMRGGAAPRVLPFGDVRTLGGLLQRAGFALPVVDTDRVEMTYETPLHLMQELRAFAATNILEGRERSFLSRQLLVRAAEIYSRRYAVPGGRVRVTVEIITLTGWAPGPDQQQPLRPGSANARLADVLGTDEHPLTDE